MISPAYSLKRRTACWTVYFTKFLIKLADLQNQLLWVNVGESQSKFIMLLWNATGKVLFLFILILEMMHDELICNTAWALSSIILLLLSLFLLSPLLIHSQKSATQHFIKGKRRDGYTFWKIISAWFSFSKCNAEEAQLKDPFNLNVGIWKKGLQFYPKLSLLTYTEWNVGNIGDICKIPNRNTKFTLLPNVSTGFDCLYNLTKHA